MRLMHELHLNAYVVVHSKSNLCKGDVGEFNQCQSQLQMLFADGLPGSIAEFMAYRLLYYTMQGNAVGKK